MTDDPDQPDAGPSLAGEFAAADATRGDDRGRKRRRMRKTPTPDPAPFALPLPDPDHRRRRRTPRLEDTPAFAKDRSADTPEAESRPRRKRPPRPAGESRLSLFAAFAPTPYRATVAVMLVLLVVLGGGGPLNPITEMALEVGLALILVALRLFPALGGDARPIPRMAWLLVILALALPVLQLIPLPPAVWHSLPGRAGEIASLGLVGAAQAWMPLTQTPAETTAALIGMTAIAALHLCVTRLDVGGRTLLCAVLLGLALLSVLVGALQIVHAAGLSWSFYSEIHQGWLIGFHSNRNAETETLQAAIMALAVVLVAGGSALRRHRYTPPAAAICLLLLLVGTVLTGSRAGLLLLPETILVFVAILWPVFNFRIRHLPAWIAGIAGGLGLAGWGLAQFPVINAVINRFSLGDEARFQVWANTLYALRQSWPAGTGIGSFPIVFPTVETLEMLIPENTPRAHNDWLEWGMEAGIAGVIVIAIMAALLLWRTQAAWRESRAADADPARRAQVLFACGVMLHIALHAIVDFPVRIMSLAGLVAIGAAFLMPLTGIETDAEHP